MRFMAPNTANHMRFELHWDRVETSSSSWCSLGLEKQAMSSERAQKEDYSYEIKCMM